MAVQHQARFAGGLAGCLPLPPCAGGGILVDEQTWAFRDYGALLSPVADDGGYRHDCAARSDLTCNGGAVAVPSRKRGIEDDLERYYAPASSAAALLPFPAGMHEPVAVVAPRTAAALGSVAATSRMADSAAASTSGRPPAIPIAASAEDALVAELCQQQGAEIDAIVRAGCDRLRAGLEQARAAAAGAARVLRDREVELAAARRRAAELEERLRQASAESQAWRDMACGNEAVAAGLRATLEAVLLGGAGALAPTAKGVEEESFGDFADPAAALDDAQSCCFVEAEDGAAAAAASRWACRACGGETSVLLLPCRHLCLCKACEPRADACPVCLAAKSGAIHVAAQDV